MICAAFIVTKAKLSVNEKKVLVQYREPGSTTPNVIRDTELDAKKLEHYLQCLHDVDCPTLLEWILRTPPCEIYTRVAAYMECMMWANCQTTAYSTYDDYRNHIGTL